jgi:hypothetical protein
VRRRGFTVAELAVAAGVGVIIAGAGLLVMLSARAAESRAGFAADAVEQAVHAQLALDRDLAALHHGADAPPARVAADAAAMELATWPAVQVRWLFDAATGTLTRTAAGERPARFLLGKGAVVRFCLVDPGYAYGGPPVLGAYGNRVAYRISAGTFTLTGAAPLRLKASRDTFPFWNPAPEETIDVSKHVES